MNRSNGVDAEAVRAHVERITSSDLFASAQRLCRFLRFTVESALAGREDQVKEYILGRQVFDRGEGYDTRLDPIVRVEARRLRSRLAEYYGGPGRDEPLRLEYPRGRYVPIISSAAAEHASTRKATVLRRWSAAVIAAALAAVAVGVAYLALHTTSPSMIATIPDSWIQANDGTLDASDVTLAQDVGARLADDPAVNEVAWPEIARRQGMRARPLADLARDLHASQLLVILVRDVGASRNAMVFLIDEPSGRKRLALSYPDIAASGDAQNELAVRMVRDVETRQRI
jgi:hypothetical protein